MLSAYDCILLFQLWLLSTDVVDVGSRVNSSAYFIEAALSTRIGDPSLVELMFGVVCSSF